jgi:hypothetical protein
MGNVIVMKRMIKVIFKNIFSFTNKNGDIHE